VLLLGALYVAVDLQLRFAQAGRDRVENSTLSRSIFARITSDTTYTIGLPDTARFRLQAAAAGSTSTSTTTTSTTGSSTTGAATTGAATSGASTTASAAPTTNTNAAATFTNGSGVEVIIPPFGIMGDNDTLTMFISKVPREMITAQLEQQESDVPIYGDVRRVSYWLDGELGGLVRQEIKILTSDSSGAVDPSQLPPNVSDPTTVSLLADEVKSVKFEYFDGQNWNDTWDSTVFGADGVTPLGSPVAVRVTLGIQEVGKTDPKQYVHVIVIDTANGSTPMTPATGNSTTGGGTTSP